MGGLNSGPGPGITLLIAIVLVLAQTASSAPLYEEDEGQESNSQALAESHGCYYNFQHYNEGERILTNEPCLNCTCRNRMLMCYLRVCPFTKGIGQNCTVEKVPGQCCPIITCPEVPVQLLTSTTTEGIKAPGSVHGTKGTAVGHLDTNGCNIDGIFYPNGAQVPGSPEKPCELCYCIRNKTACIMQECALHVDGCRPVYEEGQCFPVRYQCDDSPYEEEPTTTIRPAPTPGLIITTTSSEPLDCSYNNEVYEDGSRIQTEDPCEHCYCLKGKIACAVQECGAPLEKEGQNCTALPPAPGKCCPDSYQCDNNTIVQAKESFLRKDRKHKFDPKHLEHNDITMASNQGSEGTTEGRIPSVADAGHPTDGYHPDQGTRTTEEPKHTTNRLNQVTEAVTASKETVDQKPAVTPDVKPQELDKGTQNESTESHLEGLHPMKPSSTSDYDQKITFPEDKDDGAKPSGITGSSESGRPEGSEAKKPEGEDHTTEGHIIHMPHEKQPHPESESHKQDFSTKAPETADHQTDSNLPYTSPAYPTQSHGQNAYDSTTNDVLRPQTSAPNAKDPLLDKLHNIIQDVQSQVSDGKTTEMPEQVDYQTTPQSQTGHFTDKPDILAHLPHFGSQTSTPSPLGTGNTTSGSSPEDSNDIINKLQGIIQGIYSHVTDSVMSTKAPEGTTAASHPVDNSAVAQPEGESQSLSQDGLKPQDGSKYPEKPVSVQRPHDTQDTEKPEGESKYPSGKPKPEDGTKHPESVHEPQGSKHPTKTHPESQGTYVTEYPDGTDVPGSPEDSNVYSGKPGGIRPQGSIKLPTRPKPSSADEPYGTEYPETTDIQEESYNTESPYVTDTPVKTKHPQGTSKYPEKIKPEDENTEYPGATGVTKVPFDKEKYPAGHKPSDEHFSETEYPEVIGVTGGPHDPSHHPEKFPSEKRPGQYPHGSKPTGQGFKPSGEYPDGIRPADKHPEGAEPNEKYPEKAKPSGETPYGTEYPESVTGRPGYEGPTGHYPHKYRPGQRPGQYPGGIKPGQKYPDGSRPTGQYPDETKPFGTEETPYGTEYPEGVTGRPEYEGPSEHYPDKYKPGQRPDQQYPVGSRPTGQYPDETKPFGTDETPYGTEYPESVTGRPGYEGPTGHYPHKYRPGQRPGQYPGGIKPGQKYPDGSRPTFETKPFGTEETPYGTEYPEGATGRPDYEGPSGHYPHKYRPGQRPDGSKPTGQYPEKTKPHGTEYPEGVTDTPEDYTKYPEGVRPTEEYPDEYKPGQIHPGVKPTGQRPEDYRPSQHPEGFKPTGQYPDGYKPSSQYPHGVRPVGQEPEKYKPDQHPEALKPEGQYPEYVGVGQQYPEGSKPTGHYPDETKPFGTDETPYGTDYPESVTGRPGYEGPSGRPDKYRPGQRPGQQYPEGIKPGQKYPVGSRPTGQYPHETKPFGTEETPYGTEYPEGVTGRPDYERPSGQYPDKYKPGQYPHGSRPTGEYPEKTKPFGTEETPYGTEETPYGTELPEGVTGQPDDYTKRPDGVRPTEKRPGEYEPGQYPEGFKPTGLYPGGVKPTSQYPHEGKPTGQHPEGFKPTGQYPVDAKPEQQYPEGGKPAEQQPGQKYPDGSRPTGQYPQEIKPFGTEETPYGTEYPEGVTGRPEYEGPSEHYPDKYRPGQRPDQQYPVGSRPTGQYPDETKPFGTDETPYGTEYPESVTGRPGYEGSTGHYPHKYRPGQRPGQYPGGVKPGQKYPDGSRPTGQYPDETKPFGTEETPYGTDFPEGVTRRPGYEGPSEHYSDKHKPGQRPDQQHPVGSRPTGEYPEKTKPYGTEYPEGVTGKPDDFVKYPTGEYPEGTKPTGHYPGGVRPDESYPQGSRPTVLHPDKTKPVDVPNGTEYPSGQYPEKVKPTGSESTTYETESSGSVTGKPDEESKYPDGVTPTDHYQEKYKPAGHPEGVEQGSGHYPDGEHPGDKEKPTESLGKGKPSSGVRPTEKYPDGVKPTDGSKHPLGSELSTEYPEGVTGKPEDDSKYPSGSFKPGVFEGSTPVGDYGTEYPQSGGVTGRPGDVTKHPQGGDVHSVSGKPHEHPEKQTELESYGTDNPEESGLPVGSTEYPEKFPGRPELSTKHPQENKPEYSPGNEYPEKTGTLKPEGEYLEGQKPTKGHPESSQHPEAGGFTDRPEHGTKYPDDLSSSTQYPDGSKHPHDTGKPHDSSKYPSGSEDPGSGQPGTTKQPVSDVLGVHSKHPEDTKHPVETPSGTEYPEGVTGKPDEESKYPDGFRPTSEHHGSKYPSPDKPHDTDKYPEGSGVTGKPGDESDYPKGSKPTHEYPLGSKHPVTYKPHGSEPKPGSDDESFGTEYPETTGRPEIPYEQGQSKYPEKNKPAFDSEHPDGFKPTGEYPEESKYPGFTSDRPQKVGAEENEPHGTEYPDSTARPDDQSQHLDDNLVTKKPVDEKYDPQYQGKVTERPTGGSKYPQKPKPEDEVSGVEYTTDGTSTVYPKGTKPSEDEEIGTESGSGVGLYPGVSKRPTGSVKHPQRPKPGDGTEYPELSGITDKPEGNDQVPDEEKPDDGHKYPQKPSVTGGEPTSSHRPSAPEKYPELYGVTEVPDSEDKAYGTDHPEGVTGRPEDSNKYPDGSETPSKLPEKSKPEYTPEGSSGVLEENATDKPYESEKYPEEAYVTHYPERPKPPSAEDQLLETGTKPDGLVKYPEKIKPVTEESEEGNKYPEESKPSLSGQPQEPGTHGYPEGITKSPYHTTKRPQRPGDKPSVTEHPEETPEHPVKFKPGKYPEQSKPVGTPYGTEYPETTHRPDDSKPLFTLHPEETGITGKPQDLSKHPGKPEYPTTVSSKEKPFDSAGEPDDEHKRPQDSKYPTKTKPGSDKPHDAEQQEISGSHEPFGTEYPEGTTGKPDYVDHHPEKYSPEKLGETKRPVHGNKHPERPEDETYGTENPETTGRPEDIVKYPDGFKPVGQKRPQGSARPGSQPQGPEYPEEGVTGRPQDETKYPEESTSTEYYPQRPHHSDPSYGTEYPDSEGTDRPEYHENFKPTGHHQDTPQGSTKYPEGVRPHDSQYPTGRPDESSPAGTHPGTTGKPYYVTKYPGVGKPHFTEYPEGETGRPDDKSKQPEGLRPEKPGSHYGTEYPEGVTSSSEDFTKYPESFSSTGLYPGFTGRPQDHTKFPEGFRPTGKHPEKPHGPESIYGSEYPEGITDRPDHTKYPEGMTGRPEIHTSYPDGLRPTEQFFGKPHGTDKYPGGSKPHVSESPYGTDYPEGVTSSPVDHINYPGLSSTGKYPDKYPEGGKPHGTETSHGTEYPEGVTGVPEDDTKHPEGLRPTGHYPGITGRPSDHTKYPGTPQGAEKHPEVVKPHDFESPYGTEYPEGITGRPEGSTDFVQTGLYPGVTGRPEDSNKYPEGFKPTGQFSGEPHGRPQGSEKYPESGSESPYGTEYPEGVTGKPDDVTKYPESYTPTGQYPGKPHGTDKYPEEGKPHDVELPYGTEYPEGVTGTSEDHTKYPEGHYSGRPHGTDKYPEVGKPHGSGYPERVTSRPQDHTKHPEASSTGPSEDNKTPEEPTDSLYTTEVPHIPGITEKYPEKFKPGVQPDQSTEVYPNESKRPHHGEKPHDETEKPGVSSKHPGTKPADSEDTVYGTEYPEGVTVKPEDDTQYTDGFRPTEHYPAKPFGTDGKPQGSVYPEGSKYPVTDKPYAPVKHPQRPKPGLEDESYGTEYPETSGSPEEQPGYTRYPDESSTSQYPQRPESGVTGLPDDLSQYPEGFKPSSGKYPESLGVTVKPHGSTKHPASGDEHLETQDVDEDGRPHGSTVYPGEKKPDGTEYPDTEVTDKPDRNKYPEGSKYPGSEQPGVKHPQKPKPTDSDDILHSTEYPEKTDFDENVDSTETPEYLHPGRPKPDESEGKPYGTEYPDGVTSRPEDASLYPGISKRPTKYPQRPKPEVENERPSTEFPEETGFTGKPDDETKYPDKTGYLTRRPVPGKPKPTDSETPYVTEYPEESGKPETVQGTEYPEESGKYPTTDHPHGTSKYPVDGEDSHKHPVHRPQVTEETEKPHGIKQSESSETPDGFHPTGQYPEGTEKPHLSSKHPQRPKPSDLEEPYGEEHPEATEEPESESPSTEYPEGTGNTLRPELGTVPESSLGTHKRPQRPKPTGFEDEPFGSGHPEAHQPEDDDSTTKGPDTFGKYPAGTKPGTEYPQESDVTGKPGKHPDGSKPEHVDKYSTELPDEEQKPEGIKPSEESEISSSTSSEIETPEGVTGKPVDDTKLPGEGGIKPTEKDSTEYPSPIGATGQPEDEFYGTGLPGVTRKPATSSGVPTDELSTKYPDQYSTPKPGTAYLPQGGKLPSEKIPSSEHLDEDSAPEISEHPAHTETILGFTDRIPATGSPTEENLLSNLHHFESLPDKPSSADLTHEHQTSSPGQDSTTKLPGTHAPEQPAAKPFDKTKPTEFDATKPEDGSPVSPYDYSGKPKPVVPGEGLYNEQDSPLSPIPSHPSGTSEVSTTELPSGEHQPSDGTKQPTRHPSTRRPDTKYPGSLQDPTGDVKYPEDVSAGQPQDHTTPGSHKDTTTKQPFDGVEDLEGSTDQPEATTEGSDGHPTHEGSDLPSGGFTRRPVSSEGTSQGVGQQEETSTGLFTDIQKTTTPTDNDLINKLHDIISGIQSQVTDGKTTKLPHEGYDSTSPYGSSTELPQDRHPATDKFGRPTQRPHDSLQPSHGQGPDGSGTPTDEASPFENEIYDQTTTNAEDTEGQTDRPDLMYPFGGGSTEHSLTIPSKGPEGIRPDEVEDNLSTESPDGAVTVSKFEEHPHGSKPEKPETTEYLKPEKPTGQSSPTSKYPTDELLSTAKPDEDSGSSEPYEGTEVSGRPSTHRPEYPEKASAGSPHHPLTPDQTSPTTSRRPENPDDVTTETVTERDGSTGHPHSTEIYQEVKGDKKPTEDTDNLITEDHGVAPHQPITEDTLHTVTPLDPSQKHTSPDPTDKPLHVVYPTYYPEGVVTHKPGSKPDGQTDKKVTVTPESIPHGEFSTKTPESDSTGVPVDDETHTVYEVQTEISSEPSTSSPIVIVQEVHTEVHSERATTKPETEGYVKQTTKPTGEEGLASTSGKPLDHKPDDTVEGLTKQPESSGQTPQIVFGRPAITQPTGDELKPESQTLRPHGGYSESEKSPNLSTDSAKQPESTTKPGLVTVTPVGFSPVTKESQHIMHLYSPKDKHPASASSPQQPQLFTTLSPTYNEGVKHTTEKEKTTGFTESQTVFVTDSGVGVTHKPESLGTRFPSRKTTQKPTDGVPTLQEGTTITPTQGISEEHQVPHSVYPGVTKQPPFLISTEGLPAEVTGYTTPGEGTTQPPQGASYVPYKLKNGTKVYYPEKETSQEPSASDLSPFDGYDHIPYEIVNGTKFFYPNRVVTPQPVFTTTTGATQMGMYVPYKVVNGTKVYYTQDKPEKPEKFDGLDYVPFDLVNGTKVFYPERVTTAPPPTSAMYVPFKIINDTKVYYPKDAQDEPQDIPDEYDGFDYIPYDIVNGKKVFRPDQLPGHVPVTTERFQAMYVPYKLINGNKVYYPKDAQTKPESVPEEYDGSDFVPYEVVNGTKVFQPDRVTPEEDHTTKIPAMFVPYKKINGTKVYFPKYAQAEPTFTTEDYDGFDYLPYEEVNGTKIFRPEKVVQKPQHASTPAFYPNGMFVPYKIINNQKVFFPKDAQYKPRPLKPGYDGVQYLPYEVINGTKVFYPEKMTTPAPPESSAMYVPFKLINGTKVYYADKATENPKEIPEGYEGFDYLPYEVINGNKVFYPERVAPTMGMYVPYKKLNGTKVYYPKDSSEKEQSVPEGYDGVDYIPYEVINGTKVFYPDRATATRPTLTMYVPYKMVNGTKVYYPKDAQSKPYLVPEGYDGFDSLPYEIVNGTKVFHPEDVTERPAPTHPQGMFVPYKMVNGTKVYYPQEAHKRPHPLSDEYAGLDYVPYDIVNGTKVFHPERVTPGAVPAMYVPYKLVNGTKVFYPKHAQHTPQEIPAEYDGFDYVPFEIVNGTQVFYPNRVPNYQGMYVPYKIVNGEKVFYPKYAQHKPSTTLDGYDGFDYLPYDNVNGTKVFRPAETVTETPFEQAMYVPYKVINGTKVFYPKYAQFKPYLIPEGYDGFDYIPYEIVNGTKVFDPELAATPGTPYRPAMYVPFKIVNGKKVYYIKHAQNKPHLVPEGYDGFDYIPYEVINGTKVFDPQHAISPGTTFKPALYVPYKFVNGMKVYQPKLAQQKPTQVPQGYDGFDYLPYDVINGNKLFYPEQLTPVKQAMYVPYKLVNGTKVFYPKYAQYVPTQTLEGYDGFEYIPYEVVNGEKVFHPEEAVEMETPVRKAMYVPYKVVNGTKVYYPKYAQHSPQQIPSGYEGFDYLPYELVNGNKVFHPEQATPGTPFNQALYVPFRFVNGTKVYYPNYAQPKPQLIPEGYDGFDYLPYEVINGTKVFDPKVTTKPTYLQGMYVPYKLSNNTKVFYPKDAHNKPNYVPPGYSGADYVPYELVNNTKMFYPELISTANPSSSGSAGVYVPFRIINNKKVFYPKEATPFPPTVRHPYDGVAFIPNKALPGTTPSEIVYVDDEEALKPFSHPGKVPGEGSCFLNNRTFANNTEIPPVSPCQTRCICLSSVVRCVRVKCPPPPENKFDCSPVYREGSCCPTYACGDSDYEYPTTVGYSETKVPQFSGSSSSGHDFDITTPFTDFTAQKKPSHESGDMKGGSKPEEESLSGEYHLHKPPKPKPGQHESLEPYDSVEGQLSPEEDYDVEDEEPYGPGTCRYAGKVYVSAQQIPRDDPCDFCFCFRSDIICLQQSCPPPIPGCRDEPIQGFCCPRYECHVKMATLLNVTSTTTTTTTTLPPHFFPHAFKGSATRTGCFVQGRAYRVGQPIPSASGPCMDCICGGNGRMKCEPKVCTPEPMIRKMISPSENTTSPTDER